MIPRRIHRNGKTEWLQVTSFSSPPFLELISKMEIRPPSLVLNTDIKRRAKCWVTIIKLKKKKKSHKSSYNLFIIAKFRLSVNSALKWSPKQCLFIRQQNCNLLLWLLFFSKINNKKNILSLIIFWISYLFHWSLSRFMLMFWYYIGVNGRKNFPNSVSWASIKVTWNSFCLTL